MNRRMVRRPGTDLGVIQHEQSEAAAALLKKQGLHLADKPRESIPSLADYDDLTSLPDHELMGFYIALSGWSAFLSGQVSCAQIDERAAEKTLRYAEATAMVTGWGGKTGDRVAIAKAEMALDPEVRRLQDVLDERHAYRKLTEVLAANVERDQFVVSREITRRSNSEPRSRRSERHSA